MDGQAPLYAAIAALLYVMAEILKAALQHWRETRAELARAQREKEAAEKVAAEVKEVKTALVENDAKVGGQLDGLAKVAKSTHTLVNANMGAQLKISSVALRRVAALTNNAEDVAAADLAEKLMHEHEGKQAKVDANEADDAKDNATESLTIEPHETATIEIKKT